MFECVCITTIDKEKRSKKTFHVNIMQRFQSVMPVSKFINRPCWYCTTVLVPPVPVPPGTVLYLFPLHHSHSPPSSSLLYMLTIAFSTYIKKVKSTIKVDTIVKMVQTKLINIQFILFLGFCAIANADNIMHSNPGRSVEETKTVHTKESESGYNNLIQTYLHRLHGTPAHNHRRVVKKRRLRLSASKRIRKLSSKSPSESTKHPSESTKNPSESTSSPRVSTKNPSDSTKAPRYSHRYM